MDAAIFFPKRSWLPGPNGDCNVFEWLSMVHGENLCVIKQKLDGLKSKSLLENLGDGSEEIGMHDLWREFAIMKLKGGESDLRPWIYETIYGCDDSRRKEYILPTSNGWENLQRLCLVGDKEEGCYMDEIDLRCYSNLKVLKLVDVYTDTGVLDVRKLTQLRSLEIFYSQPWNPNIRVHGLECLKDLVFLHLNGRQTTTASLHEDIELLTRLQVVHIQYYELSSRPTRPNFSKLIRLRDVSLIGCREMDTIRGLSSSLKRLQLSCCSSLRRCHGVGYLVALEELDLTGCNKLEELPNLRRVQHLLKLDISYCTSIKMVPGLGDLVSLQEFIADHCDKLAELPEMCKLINLQRLHVNGCPSLKAIPGLSDLVALEALEADSGGLEGCHDLRRLTKLERVLVNGWGAVQGLPCLADLVNLKSLDIGRAEELTGLSDLKRLEKLTVRDCGSLREWKIGSGLRLFGVDLHTAGTFPHLKILNLYEVGLSEVPDLSSFPQLSELSLRWCKKLTSLASSAPLTALKRLDLFGCESLRALPDVSHLVSLSTLRLHDCGELKLTAHEMEKLQTMCPGLELEVDESHLNHGN